VRELVVRIPDVDAFLALAPEELAAKMLFLMREANRATFTATALRTSSGINWLDGAELSA